MKKFNPIIDFFNLMYPNLCVVCNENLLSNEMHLCMKCLHEMPKTNFHLDKNNPIEKRFWGKVEITSCTAYFYFHKGSPFQKILHSLKYRANKELGQLLGKYAAVDLLDSINFSSVDIIVPVPLHPKKLKSRGYNQSEWIGMGLSEILQKPQDTTTLIRVQENSTQTKKSVFERYENTEGIFKLSDNTILAGKHILLVDDVMTTGSTLEACIKALQQTENVKVSVFTLAVA